MFLNEIYFVRISYIKLYDSKFQIHVNYCKTFQYKIIANGVTKAISLNNSGKNKPTCGNVKAKRL